jgi:hypothetical protein
LGDVESARAPDWVCSLSQPKSDLSDFGHFKCRTQASPSSGGDRERTEIVAPSSRLVVKLLYPNVTSSA